MWDMFLTSVQGIMNTSPMGLPLILRPESFRKYNTKEESL